MRGTPENWIKLHVEILRDPKMFALTPEERWLWVGLLCLAGDVAREDGILKGYPIAMIAGQVWLPVDTVEKGLAALGRAGFIERRGDEALHIRNWVSRQMGGSMTEAERKRQQRLSGQRPENVQSRGEERREEEIRSKAGGEASSPPTAPHMGCTFCAFICMTWEDVRKVGELHDAWAKAYPAVDLLAQAQSARAWELANPTLKKHNHARFLQNWFTREQDRGGNGQKSAFSGISTVLRGRPPQEGTLEWEKAKEEANSKAKRIAEAQKAKLDAQLAVPTTTPEERKAILSKIKGLATKMTMEEEKT